jgi:hypothetical protein
MQRRVPFEAGSTDPGFDLGVSLQRARRVEGDALRVANGIDNTYRGSRRYRANKIAEISHVSPPALEITVKPLIAI